ncbi:MAG: alpha/beta hydrolase-fold protein [Bacteroidota bacterium]
MYREYNQWFSPHLNRKMELLIFGHAGARVLVFPTRRGRFYDYENFGMVGAIQHALENGWLQLYCVDSVDAESLYDTSRHPRERLNRHRQYEQYIIKEVIPLTQHKNPNSFLIAHGCSLGAYHAVNIALRHPHLFGKVVGLSGRYDLSSPVAEFRGLFDGYYDEDIYFHTPNHYVPNLQDDATLQQLRQMQIVLAAGDGDPFVGSNWQLSASLWDKNVPNALHVWEGRAHQACYWQQMVQLYL